MKKIMGLLLLLTLFMLTSCSNQEEHKKVTISTSRISPKTNVEFNTNFDYNKYDVLINGSPVDFKSSPGSFVINNTNYGEKNITLRFFNDSNELITEYSTPIFYDNIGPEYNNLNIFIEKSILNINFNVSSDDYKYSKLIIDDSLVSTTTDTSFYENIKKNTGNKNITLEFIDKTDNITKVSTIVNTEIDNKPKIVSNTFNINLFSEYKMQYSDDWDKELSIFISGNGSNTYFNPYKLLETSLSTATINAFDSSNNFDKKTINISKDADIPKAPDINSRLISSNSGFFSWAPDPEISNYLIEVYEDDYGWYPKYKTDSSFFEIKDENLSFVRKISKNGTKGFPSPPIVKFTDNLKPYASGILDNIKENSILNQINSPFIVASDILIDKGVNLFIESGTILRFFADSRLIIRGNLFIMPGLVKSKIIGNGLIVMDGGNLIVSDTDFENINITGNEGKLIFLENSSFINDSEIDVKNISRLQMYNVDKNKGTNKFKNISGIFLSNSNIDNLSINNSNEVLVNKSNINDFEQNFRTRSVIEKSKINKLKNYDFSYIYSIDSNIEDVQNDNFSLYLKSDGE